MHLKGYSGFSLQGFCSILFRRPEVIYFWQGKLSGFRERIPFIRVSLLSGYADFDREPWFGKRAYSSEDLARFGCRTVDRSELPPSGARCVVAPGMKLPLRTALLENLARATDSFGPIERVVRGSKGVFRRG